MVIFLNLDGTAQKVTPERVFQGSNNVTDVTVVAPFPDTTALEMGFILPDGYATAYTPMQFAGQEFADKVSVWQATLKSSVTAQQGDLMVAINAVTLQGNTTSYLCKVQVEESVLPMPPPEPEPDVYQLLLLWLQNLDKRTTNVPNLVKSIEKVEGTDNAFTYTTDSGLVSAPIVIGAGSDPPAYLMASYTGKIPDSAWQPILVGTETVGYTYTVPAAVHGQMKDGAKADDLWVSFLDHTTASQGEIKRYSINSAGDIVITINEPVDLVVRVWNGIGIRGEGIDDTARAQIAQEIERAEAAESNLQAQIDVISAQELIRINFDTVGWSLSNNVYGAYHKSLTVPTGKRIIGVYQESDSPRGYFEGSTVYANEPFMGYVIIG